MAAERFSLLLESQTRGTAEVAKLEETLRRLIDTSDRAGKKSGDAVKRQTDELRGTLDSFKNAIQNPFAALSEGAENFALKFGKVGLVAAGTTAAIGAAAAAAFTLAKNTADLAEQHSNAAQILGLSIREYGQFSQVAENAGLDAAGLTGIMRGLSKALSDQDEDGKKAKRALSEFGISATDAFGKVLPTKDLLLQIGDALGSIENPAKKAEASVAILGRGGLTYIPLLNKELRASFAEMERLNVGFDEFSANTALRFDSALDRMTTKLKVFSKELGVAIAGAAGFADPRAEEAAANRLAQSIRDIPGEADEIRRTGVLTLTPEQLRGGLNLSVGGVTAEQLLAQQKQTARARIAQLIEGKDAQSKIAAARKDLDDAVAAADVAGVQRAQARIASLEAGIKAAQEEEARRRALAALIPKFEDRLNYGANFTRGSRNVANLLSQIPQFGQAGEVGDLPGRQISPGLLNIPLGGVDQFNEQQRLEWTRQTVDLEIQRIALISNGEASAVLAIRDLRLSIAETDIERARISKEAELEILSLRKQQTEQGRRNAESLFDAAVSGGQGLRSFITSQALGIPRTIAGNLGAELGGLTGRFSLGLGGTAGRLLAGTPFGADPLKAAGDVQMTAAQIQLQAAQINSGRAVTGTAGIGALGTIFGGATSNPLIFNALGGGSDLGNLPSIRGGQNLNLAYQMAGLRPPGGISGLSRGVGIAGTLAAGAFGAYSGFSAGGLQGALTGTSSLAGAAAGLLPLIGVSGPAAPILGAVALGLGITSALMGNPKQKYAEREARMLEGARFSEPMGREYVSDISGAGLDYDRRGNIRVTNVTVNNNVSAIDQRGVSEFFERHGGDVAHGIVNAVNGGQAGDFAKMLTDTVRTY